MITRWRILHLLLRHLWLCVSISCVPCTYLKDLIYKQRSYMSVQRSLSLFFTEAPSTLTDDVPQMKAVFSCIESILLSFLLTLRIPFVFPHALFAQSSLFSSCVPWEALLSGWGRLMIPVHHHQLPSPLIGCSRR